MAKLLPGTWRISRSIFRANEKFIRNNSKRRIVKTVYLLLETGGSGVALYWSRFGGSYTELRWGVCDPALSSRTASGTGLAEGITGQGDILHKVCTCRI